MIRRVDTVVLRVGDLAAAERWYREVLGLEAVFHDAEARLTVLGLEGTSLTLWERPAGEGAPPPAAGTFPILAVDDAARARDELAARGAAVGPLEEGGGVRFFRITDAAGNVLEACQAL